MFVPQSPKSNIRDQGGQNEAEKLYHWWKNCKRVKYTSTLYVTIQAIEPPNPSGISVSSQPSLITNDTLEEELKPFHEQPKIPVWTRGPGQTCNIPKVLAETIQCGDKGVNCMKFSNDGRSLALAFMEGQEAIIAIYDVYPTFNKCLTLRGHTGTIYELDWYQGQVLLSASSDGTAQVWHIGQEKRDIMEHPSFVYCAKFHPNSWEVIITGGYDKVIRIWKHVDGLYNVMDELVGHTSFVTTLAMDIEGQKLYSGDKAGGIKVWEAFESTRDDDDSKIYFRSKKDLRLSELEGKCVAMLNVHPGGRRLLVHSTSLVSPLIMVDLKQGSVMQEYKMDKGLGKKVGNCITPCGSLVFSGSHHGAAFVWDTDTGEEKFIYEIESGAKSVHSIEYHPYDHMVAIGTFGARATVQLYKYKKTLL